MGEIGIDRREFLHELSFWQIRAIITGYRQRCRPTYEAARLAAFLVMTAIPMTDLRKAGITSPSRLVRFPWDRDEEDEQPTDEQVAKLQEEMRAFNAKSEEERAAILNKRATE